MASASEVVREIIINIFQSRRFKNVKTFICRVLYEIVIKQDHLNCKHIMIWAQRTYRVYFAKEEIPRLHARILYQVHQDESKWRRNFKHVVTSSTEHMHQKHIGTLSLLSQYVDFWQQEDGFYSAEDLHLMYLTDYYQSRQLIHLGRLKRRYHRI